MAKSKLEPWMVEWLRGLQEWYNDGVDAESAYKVDEIAAAIEAELERTEEGRVEMIQKLIEEEVAWRTNFPADGITGAAHAFALGIDLGLVEHPSERTDRPVASVTIRPNGHPIWDLLPMGEGLEVNLPHALYLAPQRTDREREATKYHELLYAVASRFPGETRHETALRYIRDAESRCSGPHAAQEADDDDTR